MAQASFLLNNNAPETDKRGKVLAPFPVAKAYDYFIPEGINIGLGDYVKVPLGKKETIGVVWSMEGDEKLDPARIKPILQKYDMPPLAAVHRRFIDKVAE